MHVFVVRVSDPRRRLQLNRRDKYFSILSCIFLIEIYVRIWGFRLHIIEKDKMNRENIKNKKIFAFDFPSFNVNVVF